MVLVALEEEGLGLEVDEPCDTEEVIDAAAILLELDIDVEVELTVLLVWVTGLGTV